MEEKKVIDPNSRDYSLQDIEEDPRFKVCLREFFICLAVYFVYAGMLLIFMYTLGAGDPKGYTYVLGMPLWFFLCLASLVLIIGVVWFLLDRVFLHMDLDPLGSLRKKEGR